MIHLPKRDYSREKDYKCMAKVEVALAPLLLPPFFPLASIRDQSDPKLVKLLSTISRRTFNVAKRRNIMQQQQPYIYSFVHSIPIHDC